MSSQSTATDPPAGEKIPLMNLFTGFLMIGLMGFGGIAQSAQYVMIERRKWMSSKEFVEMLGICSILPGGNFLNASVILGDRNHGLLGSIACLGALLLMPMVILLGIAFAYDTYSYLPDVRAATAGGASAAAGLIFGMATRLVQGVNRTLASLAAGVATFLVVGILREPLWLVVVLIAPLAFLWTLYTGRRA